ncbi:carbohydrate deacetylase [Stutzerimonas stutzeri]|uniref:carbohydrate deacetylase n=1 Tax=Stutzerimonas stutzeri TaxID=316 RepID=UPI00265B6E55|nr:ChbG/HpnK family deacetylase [Stutzerimonas stutzeri]MCF6780373.1 ChbG/HpnK family deacetylase [Stutzerimonas stutzeri]MCF6804690.1 ChbG/HpnK family deacetylase [Stutzerimonas stutzeri]
MPSRVIINADDFGLSTANNQVIVAAFSQGLISSATLMANTPAFEEACQLIHAQGLHGRVGLHVNLTHGQPLTQPIQRLRQFCSPTGEFDLSLAQHSFWLSSQARDAVRQEIQAQWQRCLDKSVRPSHLDSHQHVHNLWPVGAELARFAAEQGIPLRPARNLGHNISLPKRVFKHLLNRRLRQLAGRMPDYACTPYDLTTTELPGEGTLEVIAHPTLQADGYGDEYLATGVRLDELLKRSFTGVPRIAYSEL